VIGNKRFVALAEDALVAAAAFRVLRITTRLDQLAAHVGVKNGASVPALAREWHTEVATELAECGLGLASAANDAPHSRWVKSQVASGYRSLARLARRAERAVVTDSRCTGKGTGEPCANVAAASAAGATLSYTALLAEVRVSVARWGSRQIVSSLLVIVRSRCARRESGLDPISWTPDSL